MTKIAILQNNRKLLKSSVTSYTAGSAVQVAVVVTFQGPVSDLIEFNPTAVKPDANAPAGFFAAQIDPVYRNVMGLTLTVRATGTTITADYIALGTN